MTPKEWSDQAQTLVVNALAAASGQNNAVILALQKQILDHKNRIVPGVPDAVNDAFDEVMDALFTALVNNLVQDWAKLQKDLEICAGAIGATSGEVAKAAKLISLQPVTTIATALTSVVNDVKNLKNNPQSADAVAKNLQDIQANLQKILTEAGITA